MKTLFCGFNRSDSDTVKAVIECQTQDELNKQLQMFNHTLDLNGFVTMVDTPKNRKFWEGL